jgi:hypothetical protein
MVETISPVVHGGRNRRYWSALVLHALGTTLSASLLGALLAGLGALLGAPWGDTGVAVVAAIAILYLVRELFSLPIPIPALRKQVPEWWRTFYSNNVTAFLYGLGLGVGYATYLSFGTFVVVSAAAFVSGSAWIGAVLCGAFGAARAASVALSPSIDRLDALAEATHLRRVHAILLAALALIPFL